MEPTFLAAIDLGTSYIKVGIYDTSGNCLALSTKEMKIDNPAAGVFLQSGEYIFDSVLTCFKDALTKIDNPANVKSIAFTGQMAGVMGVDENLNDITSWSCSLDTRYYPYAKNMLQKHSRLLVEISGTNSPLMAPKIEWYEKEFPEDAAKIKKYMMISSYIIAKLAKSKVEDTTIDSSFITWTGLADIANCSWSKRLCDLVGISIDKLPRITKSNEKVATMAPEYSEMLGLSPDVTLVSGSGDKVAGIVGSNVSEINDLVFEASSYGAVSCLVDKYIPNLKSMNYDALLNATDNNYILHKYIPGSGIIIKWFKDNFCEGREFTEIDLEAKEIAVGSDALMCIGLLSGSNMPFNEDIKGMFLGHTLMHKPAHFYRSLLESYAYEISLTVDSIRELYPHIKMESIKMIGGGANSSVWPQIIADVCDLRVDIMSRHDEALWGTALLAGNAIGAIDDIAATANAHIEVKQSYEPIAENKAKYNKYRGLYSKLCHDMNDYFVELNNI
ncbi:hypothetical protein L3Q72_20910 [Vibrio sp. JC009]|uniref:xylulokinase n=1 Tax=Vibrio sp. JC009 TaxID=2912314 RepID=UPI0023B0EC44|nr:FGGY family carbohydrate kinase [Vibrio sp. JC009]WED23699.1 hypothetical protein L3Q72_20910 [Vibrio sp. JC009]